MYLEIALDDNQANAQLFTSMLDQCTVNFRDDSIQKCLLILSLMESVSIAEKKGGDRDKLVGILHFLLI